MQDRPAIFRRCASSFTSCWIAFTLQRAEYANRRNHHVVIRCIDVKRTLDFYWGALDCSLDELREDHPLTWIRPSPSFAWRDILLIRRSRHGIRHSKFGASSMLPVPLYLATWGYGHRGRVRSILPLVL